VRQRIQRLLLPDTSVSRNSAFRTADGYLNLGAANQANWEKLCQVLERPDLLADPRYRDNPARTAHATELVAELEQVFESRPTAEWLARLDVAGVPAGPLYDMPAVYADPHVQARQMMVEIEHPTAGRIKNIGLPVKLSETPGVIRRPAPTLGQHTSEVLEEFGYNPAEIAELRTTQVVT
jgi:crotonobetainyl-CoA:carnitine CoA-transferase CaiB-like acyl-CoA transferase